MRREFVSCSQPISFVILDSEHAQNNGKSVNRGLPVLDLPRSRSSWSWLKRGVASRDENVLEFEKFSVSHALPWTFSLCFTESRNDFLWLQNTFQSDTLARICCGYYLLIPFKICRNLNYSYLYGIKKKNIYSNVTDLILTVFSNEK